MQAKKYDAIIVGAGFSGLYMLHKLRNRGFKVRVIEAAAGVGGTWYWNRYPGARCDSDSIYYCFTFSKELYQKWRWSERFASQAEILKYLNFVADELNLRPDIQLNTRVTKASYNEETKKWEIETDTNEKFEAKYFISGVGCLSTANIPKFEGIDSFKGEKYHTGKWPHEKVDFTGKRVIVIGNGSSGVQLMQEVAKEAKELTLLMRTPHYVAEARNHPLTKEQQDWAIENYEEIRKAFFATPTGIKLYTTGKTASECTPEEQQKELEYAWENGGLFLGTLFTDVSVNKETNHLVSQFVRNKIDEIVKDPETAKKLHPNYYITTKRLIIGTNFYEIFNKEHVHLVSIKENPIKRIVENGVQLSDGTVIEGDVLIFATGFDSMTGSLIRLNVHGRNGETLKEKWKNGKEVKTYLGLAVHGFPNFFMITGPQSPTVLTNMPASIEQHVDWIDECINYLEKNNIEEIEATEEAEISWSKHCDDIANQTLFPNTNSWYTGANIDGTKRKGFIIYVGGLNNYKKICDEIAEKQYEGFTLKTAEVLH